MYSDETVESMTKPSEATGIDEGILHACFSTVNELRQAYIYRSCETFQKGARCTDKRQDLPTELFPGGVTPPTRDNPVDNRTPFSASML